MATKAAPNVKQMVQVGPFEGGLNNISLSGESRDSEVVDLINMEVTVDTALTSRPPIEAMGGSTLPTTNTIGWEVLGVYRVTSAEWYLIVSVPKDGTTNVDTTIKAYLSGIVGVGETILTIKQCVGIVNRVSSMVQFKDKLFFNVDSSATDRGFYWKKGDALGGTAVATMPRGNVMISWKTRLWVSSTGTAVDGDRVWFSTIDAAGPKPDTWGAADFFDVAPGEGGFITAMVPSFNNLIIFKNDGTWRFSFPTKPAQGVVDKISGDVGCSGKNAVVDFENYMYVYDQGRVYELVNSNFTQINRFVKFTEDPSAVDSVATGVELSMVNRRVIVRYFNAIYCFSVDSKAWGQWRSYNGVPGKFISLPGDSNSASPTSYISASRGTLQAGKADYLKDPTFSLQSTKDYVQGNAGGTFPCSFNAGTLTISHTGATTSCRLAFPGTGENRMGNTPESFEEVTASPGQRFKWTYTATKTGAITGSITGSWLLKDGSVVSTGSSISYTGVPVTGVFTAPADSLRARFYFKIDSFAAGNIVTLKDMKFERTTDTSPFNLMKITDVYPNQVADFEVIDCYFQTKSYDYKTPGNFKRLFWAGIDVKTSREVKTEIRPVSRVAPVTWGQLEQYTWAQLEQGAWGNPLSWLNVSSAVFNILEADEIMSENGRYFKKLGKSLRFRQISYVVRLSSVGNLNSGPVKFFSLTTVISTKQDVVDSST